MKPSTVASARQIRLTSVRPRKRGIMNLVLCTLFFADKKQSSTDEVQNAIASSQQEFSQPKICRRRDLDVRFLARHQPRVLARQLKQLQIVGDLIERINALIE